MRATEAVKTFLILGAGGQLGVELQHAFADVGRVIALNRAACDLADFARLREVVAATHPDVILNAAAYTAVDRAESEPDAAMRINGEAPAVLAEEAKKLDALLVHYSTDYVFDGTKTSPWIEDDPVYPLNVYGATKLAGERAIEQVEHTGGRFLIFRTSWVFSPQGNNFLRTMLRLGQERDTLRIVNDQTGAPTSARALADATHRIVSTEHGLSAAAGVYHMTCAGATTWQGFAEAIFAHARGAKPWANVTGIPSSEYPTPAKRPANSVLSNAKLKAAFGVELPPWETALDQALGSL